MKVKTTDGYITFNMNLIAKQFFKPENVTAQELGNAIASFTQEDVFVTPML